MTTLYSDKCSITAGSILPAKSDLGVISVTGTYTLPASGLAALDTIQMVKVPAGAMIIDLHYTTSGATAATSTTAIGDGSSTGRFIAAASTTAAVFLRQNVVGSAGYIYTVEDTIDAYLATFNTVTAGTILRLTVTYTTNY